MTEESTKTLGKALRLRKRMKAKKPKFVRPESWRYVRLKSNWRKPKGLDHKVRLKYDGWPPGVRVGYRGPRVARGFHPSGYREVLVHNSEELAQIDPNTQVVRIAHTVGKRKRVSILTQAKKRKIIILNIKQTREEVTKEEKELPEEQAEQEIEELKEEEAEEEKPKEKKKTRKSKEKKEQ